MADQFPDRMISQHMILSSFSFSSRQTLMAFYPQSLRANNSFLFHLHPRRMHYLVIQNGVAKNIRYKEVGIKLKVTIQI